MTLHDRTEKVLKEIDDMATIADFPRTLQCLKTAIESLVTIFAFSQCAGDGREDCDNEQKARNALVKILDQWDART